MRATLLFRFESFWSLQEIYEAIKVIKEAWHPEDFFIRILIAESTSIENFYQAYAF
jgi:hypothetical protein